MLEVAFRWEGRRFTHNLALIGLQRIFLHHWQRKHFARMQVGVDEGFSDEITASVDLNRALSVEACGELRDAAVLNPDLGLPVALAP